MRATRPVEGSGATVAWPSVALPPCPNHPRPGHPCPGVRPHAKRHRRFGRAHPRSLSSVFPTSLSDPAAAIHGRGARRAAACHWQAGPGSPRLTGRLLFIPGRLWCEQRDRSRVLARRWRGHPWRCRRARTTPGPDILVRAVARMRSATGASVGLTHWQAVPGSPRLTGRLLFISLDRSLCKHCGRYMALLRQWCGHPWRSRRAPTPPARTSLSGRSPACEAPPTLRSGSPTGKPLRARSWCGSGFSPTWRLARAASAQPACAGPVVERLRSCDWLPLGHAASNGRARAATAPEEAAHRHHEDDS